MLNGPHCFRPKWEHRKEVSSHRRWRTWCSTGWNDELAERIRKRKVQRPVVYNPKINLIRYADDFVVTGDSPETLAKVKEVVVEFLTERGLELSPEKTRIVHLSEGFNFLGQNVRLYGDKVLIKPSKEAQARIYDKIRGIVQRNKSVEQRDLIRMLNPVIQGWVNYHRHAVSSVAFSKLDHHGLEVALAVGKTQASRQEPDVDQATLLAYSRFTDMDLRSRRRHRRQAANHVPGVRDGYPDPSSRQGTSGGQPVLATVGKLPCRASVQQGANSLNGRNRLLRLWLSQDGRCPACGEPITRETGWAVLHEHRQDRRGTRSGTAIFGCCTRTAIGNIMPMQTVRCRVRAPRADVKA